MKTISRSRQKIIMDLARVNEVNAEGCPACGRKFALGEMAVFACGSWEGGLKLIHENEAVFDHKTGGYVEKRCVAGRIS